MSTLQRALIAVAWIVLGTFLCLWPELRRHRRNERNRRR